MIEYLARLVVELGVLAALVGVLTNRWVARYSADLRAAHDRELNLLRARADVAASISTAQFDAEFKAVSAIWERLHALRGAFIKACLASSRPNGGQPYEQPAKNEWLAARLETLRLARNEFAETVFKYEPFYPADLRNGFGALVDICDSLQSRALRPGAWSLEWFDDNDRQLAEFMNMVAALEQRIRARYASLRLTDGADPEGGR